MNNIKPKKTKKFKKILIWLIISFLAITIRIPTLMEPAVSDDEHFNLTMGRMFKNGSIPYEQASDIHLARLPFTFFIAAIFDNQYQFRLITIVFVCFAAIFFFELLEKLAYTKKTSILITFIYLFLVSSPLIGGNNPYLELLLAPFAILGVLLIIDRNKNGKIIITKSTSRIICASFILTLGILFKIHAVIDFLTVLLIIFIARLREKNAKKAIVHTVAMVLIALITLATVFIFLFKNGVTINRILELLSMGTKYTNEVSDWSYRNYIKTNTHNNLLEFIFSYNFKLLAICAWSIWAIIYHKKYQEVVWLISTWLFFTFMVSVLFNSFGFHYSIQTIPALILSLLIAYKKTVKKKPVIIALAILVFFHTIYPLKYTSPKIIYSYYRNYLNHITGHISQTDYYLHFNGEIIQIYDLANFIKNKTQENEKILVWSERTEIYSLSNTLPIGRYIWHSHVEISHGYEYLIQEMEKNQTRYVVFSTIYSNEMILEYLLKHYTKIESFNLLNEGLVEIYERN